MSGLIHYLRKLAGPPPTGLVSDGQLLSRFVDGRDEYAFEALMQRHGQMVLALCRRILDDEHEAEDAFQATFLLLVRKAGSLHHRDLLGNWLYGVAYRVAVRARANAVRREEQARRNAVREEIQSNEVMTRELQRAVHEALFRLPDRYREPMVLCYLEGKTQEQAAKILGWTPAAVKGQLERARALLRKRLTRWGMDAGAVSAAVGENAALAAVPPNLANATLKAALKLILGKATAGAIPASVVVLMKGVQTAMWYAKLKAAVAVVTSLFVVAGGTGLAIYSFQPTPNAQSNSNEKPPGVAAAPKRQGATQPITVTGKAKDANGKPIKGATIYLTVGGASGDELAKTTTDENGGYRFQDVDLPVSKNSGTKVPTGKFQVYGAAPEYGFAWHRTAFFFAGPRPNERDRNDQEFYLSDKPTMDLTFTPATGRIYGRIVDESRKPIIGANISLGDGANWLSGLRLVAPDRRTTRTDKDGRFELQGLPSPVSFFVYVRHPEHAQLAIDVVTGAGPVQINAVMRTTRTVTIKIIFEDSGKPAARIGVSLSSDLSSDSRAERRESAGGTTDSAGKAKLRIPPGTFKLYAAPPLNSDYLQKSMQVKVTDQPEGQSFDVALLKGCTLVTEVVDEDTGAPIPGVMIAEYFQAPISPLILQNHGDSMFNPWTDKNGRRRALMVPGVREFRVLRRTQDRSEVEERGPVLIELPAGKEVFYQFKTRRVK